MRYYEQESGSITLDGVPLKDLNIEWLRNTVGIVSQEPIIFAATVMDNLKLGNQDANKRAVIQACKLANAHEFIIKLPNKYYTGIGAGGVQLSGGQKQRLAIARALIRNPKILLLDEATSALDTESERIVQAAIDHVSSGRTCITIAHRLSTIRNAHKIIVFDNGSIVETGTHSELLAMNGVYKNLANEIEQLEENNNHQPLDFRKH
jgi:ATP-binding cassette subfamily B (MDR/TAP) protein 1